MQRILSWSIWLLILFSCSKEKMPPGTASLTMINAIVGSQPLITSFNGGQPNGYYITAKRISYGVFNSSVNRFSSYTGRQDLALYQYPDTTGKSSPLLQLVIDLPIGAMSTLFLTGTVSKPDTLLTMDQLPYHSAQDSVMGLRFLNLSPGSGQISINLADNAPGSVASSLSFKEMSAFKKFPVRAGIADYVFEFRDESGALIARYKSQGLSNPGSIYAGNAWLQKNFTLALIGAPGGSTILLVPHSL
ncbi:hypothetical protein [Chitinophaga defluvii]|uniref:DUF4397 domain-containing protein n=1 Tax=Chitinophaga defluvii TaxID=3163343 RepID=A0ABV2T3B2_9BACT